ncbi:diguanylate cyclase (GGDEF) domain-containing protein [Sphingomonas guangdongensis]|uniref:Diguanylate cyclase (GGDEF) domain-containing protein n=1 Tax=Sphingomonas guangdongensis TaxID=1141890 RepID=A0A285QC99_9SPHN|nr:sensor domain-containing diguanylate cyclase [Sphingomonas guangdongensis]SOB79560.1 diguanylate cyclase (GGDEF) domain-containing protein [Sphingomonas guangdongensis]
MFASAQTTDRDAARLRALAALQLLDTPPEAEFDALAALAAEMLSCPVGAITLIDLERQWIKAGVGTPARELPRSASFCTHTIESTGPLLIRDARRDDRVANSFLVTEAPHFRAYAGMPIHATDPGTGTTVPIGAVCALDTETRTFSPEQQARLRHLQTLAEALLRSRALRLQAEQQSAELRRADQTFRQAERMAQIGSWRMTLADERLSWSEGTFRVHELPIGAPPPLTSALDYYPPQARAAISAAIAATLETGAPFDVEVDFCTARGNLRRVRAAGELERENGEPHALIGVFRDVTDRYALEQSLRRTASIDALTGIANRASFAETLDRELAAASDEGTPLALLMIDLDYFKQINDTHGHLTGDDVLRAFARRIRRVAPDGGFAARLGGDEFALVLTGPVATDVDALLPRLLDDLRKPVRTSAGPIAASGTIGVAAMTAEVQDARALIHRSDSALYQAKRNGRGTSATWGRMRSGDREQRRS